MAKAAPKTPQVPGEPAATETPVAEPSTEASPTSTEGTTDAQAPENAAPVVEPAAEPAAPETEASTDEADEDDDFELPDDGPHIVKVTPEIVAQARLILAAHDQGLDTVDLNAPAPEAKTVSGACDGFDARGIAHSAKGRTPEPHEVDPKRIKRPVLTTKGYVVPEAQPHPAQKF